MEFLRKVRWPDGFVCPRCGERGSVTIQTRRLEQCRSCRYQASLTAGTVLDRTRKPHRAFVQGEPARAAKLLPWSHILFSNLKGWLHGTFHGVSQKHLPRYL